MPRRDLGGIGGVDRQLHADLAELLFEDRRDQRQLGPVGIGGQREGEALPVPRQDAVRPFRPPETFQQAPGLRGIVGQWLDPVVVPGPDRRREQLIGAFGIAQHGLGKAIAVDGKAEGPSRLGFGQRGMAGVHLQQERAGNGDRMDLDRVRHGETRDRGRIQREDEVRVAGLGHERPCLHPADGVVGHIRDERRLAPVVLEGGGIERQRRCQIRHAVGPGADDLAHLPVPGIGRRGQYLRAELGEIGGQRGARLAQPYDDDPLLRDDPLDGQRGERSGLAPRDGQGVHDRIRVHGRAVVEHDLLAQGEAPRQSVRGDLPSGGKTGDQLSLGVGIHQRLGDPHAGEDVPGGRGLGPLDLELRGHGQRRIGLGDGKRHGCHEDGGGKSGDTWHGIGRSCD